MGYICLAMLFIVITIAVNEMRFYKSLKVGSTVKVRYYDGTNGVVTVKNVEKVSFVRQLLGSFHVMTLSGAVFPSSRLSNTDKEMVWKYKGETE